MNPMKKTNNEAIIFFVTVLRILCSCFLTEQLYKDLFLLKTSYYAFFYFLWFKIVAETSKARIFMDATSYLLGTKQHGLQEELINLSFNISNGRNAGYKNRNMTYHTWTHHFHEAKPTQIKQADYPIEGVIWKDTSYGRLEKTGNPLQIAIKGEGFFELEDGTLTRNGNLVVQPDGTLTNPDGVGFVDAGGEKIKIEENPAGISVSSSGQIFDAEHNEIGQFRIMRFDDPNKLRYVGGNRLEADEPGQPDLTSRVLHGFTEGSNANMPLLMARAQTAVTDHHQVAIMKRDYYKVQNNLSTQLLSVRV